MNRKHWHTYQRILVFLLVIGLLAGCSRGTSPAENAPLGESTAAQEYEIYKLESLTAQKDFDALTEQLFQERAIQSSLSLHYSMADPAAYGITEYPITYGDFNSQIMKDELQNMKAEKLALDAIDVNLLTDDQQLTYRILAESYQTELAAEGLELYYQPLAPTIGFQAQLPVLLAEYAFYNERDVEEYLDLLAQTDEYFSQILAFEEEKAAAGLFMTDECLDEVLSSCDAYLLPPERNFLSETFTERLAAVPGLTEEEIAGYTAQNLTVLGENFVPAYQLLVDGLTALRGTGTNDKGLYYDPKGKEYYEYLVRSATGTTYESIDLLRDAIEDQMDADLMNISRLLKENPDVASQLTDYSFTKKEPAQILDSLIGQIDADFPALGENSYTIKYVPEALEASLSPAFYLTPPMDRYESNTIYINRSFSTDDNLFPTLAHEGYPGHLYQTVYFSSNCSDNLRKLLSFSSYSEGWAFYVETYSYSLDNGLNPQISQILASNSSSSLALHAILDLYINYYGWTKEQVGDYMKQYYDLDGTDVIDSIYTTLVANPTNYLEYYVGYLEILNMRNTAQKELGDDFNLKEFHTFLLDMGPAPFTVIEPYFKTWLMTYDL